MDRSFGFAQHSVFPSAAGTGNRDIAEEDFNSVLISSAHSTGASGGDAADRAAVEITEASRGHADNQDQSLVNRLLQRAF